MFDSWLSIVRQRDWVSLAGDDARLPSSLEGAERHRRIAAWLTREWLASRSPSHEARPLHMVDSTGEHSHLVFCHQLSSCHEAVDEALCQSAGTNLVVLYWRGGSTRSSFQRRYSGATVSPLLYPAALLLLDEGGGAEYRRVRAPPLGDAGEYSRCVTEELHSKARVLAADKVEELSRQLPSVCVGGRTNLAVGARPGDLQYTTLASGERRLQRVVAGEEPFF